MNKLNIVVKSLVLSSLLISSSLVAEPWSKCIACHGFMGEKKALGKSAIIKDMSHTDIITALKGYKTGTYGGPMKGLMKAQVMNLSDKDIEEIATHFSTVK